MAPRRKKSQEMSNETMIINVSHQDVEDKLTSNDDGIGNEIEPTLNVPDNFDKEFDKEIEIELPEPDEKTLGGEIEDGEDKNVNEPEELQELGQVDGLDINEIENDVQIDEFETVDHDLSLEANVQETVKIIKHFKRKINKLKNIIAKYEERQAKLMNRIKKHKKKMVEFLKLQEKVESELENLKFINVKLGYINKTLLENKLDAEEKKMIMSLYNKARNIDDVIKIYEQLSALKHDEQDVKPISFRRDNKKLKVDKRENDIGSSKKMSKKILRQKMLAGILPANFENYNDTYDDEFWGDDDMEMDDDVL